MCLLVIVILAGFQIFNLIHCEKIMLPSVTEYFPELKGDITKLVWAHAVNNNSLLQKALNDSEVMMLEADVVLGTLIDQSEVIPIMAHPPVHVSDLSLKMFLEKVIKFQQRGRKGIKLDFKSTESFEASWDVINPIKSQIQFPLFLNADIISGPVNSSTKPVNAEVFLSLSSSELPSSVLSIGWTTRYAPDINGSYTEEELANMMSAIKNNKILQPVTLCLRAGIAAQSHGIKNLVEMIDKYQQSNSTTVTIWMSTDSDPVDIQKLKNLILVLEKNKVFLDVPKFIYDELKLFNYDSYSIT